MLTLCFLERVKMGSVFMVIGVVAVVLSLMLLVMTYGFWWIVLIVGIFMIGFGYLLSMVCTLVSEVKKFNRAED